MISRLRGLLAEKEPTRVVVECMGIGFELKVPLSTSRRLPDSGAEVVLLVVFHATRNGVELFGFAERAERDCFRMLTSVSGVGPKAGLNLLSRFGPEEIREIIESGKVDVLRSVPGIGPKRAESIMKRLQGEAAPVRMAEPILVEAQSALVSLGLSRREAGEMLAGVRIEPGMSLQELLKFVLSRVTRR